MPTPLFASIGRRRLVVFALLLFAIFGVVLRHRPPVKAKARILPMPEKPQTYPALLPDRFIPLNWGWLWRLRYAILGYNPSIHLDFEIIGLHPIPPNELATVLPVTRAADETNLVRVWVLPTNELAVLRRHLLAEQGETFMESARMITGPGVQAALYFGSPIIVSGVRQSAGLTVDTYARLNGKAVDLTAMFTISTAVTNPPPPDFKAGDAEVIVMKTNLSLAARFVIPESNGVFLIDTSREASEQRRTAILISPRVEPYKKK